MPANANQWEKGFRATDGQADIRFFCESLIAIGRVVSESIQDTHTDTHTHTDRHSILY